MNLDDYLADAILVFRKLCHSKRCNYPNFCPKFHPRCCKNLGFHTAMLWQIAIILHYWKRGLVNSLPTVEFALKQMGDAFQQHNGLYYRLVVRLISDIHVGTYSRTPLSESTVAKSLLKARR